MSDTKVDILIVGGGVAGTTAALALKDTPFSLALVEPRKGHDVNRGDVLYPSSLEVVSELGALPYIYRKQPLPYDKEHIIHNDKEILSFDWSSLNERFPFALSIDHGDIEQALLDAAYKDTLAVYKGHVVTAITSTDTGHLVTIAGEGKETTLEAKFVIGADGRNSVVRKTLGIPTNPKKFAKDAIIFWMPIKGRSDTERVVKFYIQPPECVLTQLLPGNRLRVAIGISAKEKDAWSKKTNEEKYAYLRSFSKDFDNVEPLFNDEHIYTTQAHNAPAYGRGTMLLIGDAAHEIHPISSQGISLAIGDAYTLGRLLAKNGIEDGAKTLIAYESARKDAIEKVMEHSNMVASVLLEDYPGVQTIESLGITLLENSQAIQKLCSTILTRYEYEQIGHQPVTL